MVRNLTVAGASILMALILVIGVVACDDEDSNGGGSADISSSQLVQRVADSQNNVETTKFKMDMDMSMDGENMGQSLNVAMKMNGSGIMDNVNKEMQMEMDMSMKMDMDFLGDMDIDTDMEIYIIDGITYTKTGEMMGMPEQWMKMEMPGAWEQQDMISQQTELLEAAKLNISNGGKVNGVDTYKVIMTPNMRDLYDIMMQQQGMNESLGGSSLPADMDIDEIADMIKDFSVIQWYAKDTYFPMKAEMSMKMEMTSDMMDMGGGNDKMEMDVSINIEFYDYNKSVSISLPSEARNATDMTDMMNWDSGDWDMDEWDMGDFEFDEDDFEDMFGDIDWDDEDWDWQ